MKIELFVVHPSTQMIPAFCEGHWYLELVLMLSKYTHLLSLHLPSISPTGLSVEGLAQDLFFSLLSEFSKAASSTARKYPAVMIMMMQVKKGSASMLLNHTENCLHGFGRN